MIRVTREVIIQASPEVIWEYFEDTEKELQWRGPEVVELSRLDSGPIQVGSRYRGKTVIMGQTDIYTNELTQYDPFRKIAWKPVDTSSPMAGSGSYTLEPVSDDATRFTLTLEYQPMNFIGTLMQPMTKLVTGGVLAKFTNNLKQLCEATDPA
ncbi:MAG: SRPBCC family protein [Anaerolineales bacterium]